jgi:hypothetical protein
MSRILHHPRDVGTVERETVHNPKMPSAVFMASATREVDCTLDTAMVRRGQQPFSKLILIPH